jgi:hypothetical protein
MHLVTQCLLLPLHGSVCELTEEAGKQRGGCWKGSVTNYLPFCHIRTSLLCVILKRDGNTSAPFCLLKLMSSKMDLAETRLIR